MMDGIVYFLEFDPPIANHARFYVGWSKNERTLQSRLDYHSMGYGAAITRHAFHNFIKMRCIYTMPGSRETERRIKRQKNTPRFLRQKGIIK